MLEWYRPQWDLSRLMREVEVLVRCFIQGEVQLMSYRQSFLDHVGIDPHRATLSELETIARKRLSPGFDSEDRDVWLDLLFSHLVEPELKGLVFLMEFPAAQAALAQTTEDFYGNTVACRFELYIDGIEIANGYQEELDPVVLERRFAGNIALRAARGQTLPANDQLFLAAMQSGMPPCAGVALGVDRLFMCVQKQSSIATVMPFA
jgi:lysyl-tRNA synthetase class 2